jgi:hypothetical protein
MVFATILQGSIELAHRKLSGKRPAKSFCQALTVWHAYFLEAGWQIWFVAYKLVTWYVADMGSRVRDQWTNDLCFADHCIEMLNAGLEPFAKIWSYLTSAEENNIMRQSMCISRDIELDDQMLLLCVAFLRRVLRVVPFAH